MSSLKISLLTATMLVSFSASAEELIDHNIKTKLSMEEAKKIAQEQVAGEVVEEELEITHTKEGKEIAYEFEIKKADGEILEVEIDANTGEVIEIEKDD